MYKTIEEIHQLANEVLLLINTFNLKRAERNVLIECIHNNYQLTDARAFTKGNYDK